MITWFTSDGVDIPITEMSTAHLQNAIKNGCNYGCVNSGYYNLYYKLPHLAKELSNRGEKIPEVFVYVWSRYKSGSGIVEWHDEDYKPVTTELPELEIQLI